MRQRRWLEQRVRGMHVLNSRVMLKTTAGQALLFGVQVAHATRRVPAYRLSAALQHLQRQHLRLQLPSLPAPAAPQPLCLLII